MALSCDHGMHSKGLCVWEHAHNKKVAILSEPSSEGTNFSINKDNLQRFGPVKCLFWVFSLFTKRLTVVWTGLTHSWEGTLNVDF